MTKPLWTGGFVAATLVNFLLNVVFYLLMTTMAVYAIESFAADEAMAGLAASAYVFGALASRFLSTAMIARFGSRPVYIVGAIVATLASGLYFVVDALWALLIARVIHGMAFGVAHSAIGSMSQTRIPPSRRGEGNGLFAMSATVGTAIGPALAIAMTRGGDYLLLFTTATGVSLAALAVGAMIRPLPADLPLPARGSIRSHWIAAAAVPIGIVALLQSLGYAALTAFLADYAVEANAPEAAGWFFVLYAACVILVRLVSGTLYDRFGADVIVYPGLALYAVGFIVLVTMPTLAGILIAAVVIGFGYGALLPTGMAIAAERVEATQPGGAFATYYVFIDLGYGFGPVILGAALALWGWTGLFWSAVVAIAAAAVVYALAGRPRSAV